MTGWRSPGDLGAIVGALGSDVVSSYLGGNEELLDDRHPDEFGKIYRLDVRREQPLLIGRVWAPKPDIAVLRGGDETYAERHPRPRDLALLIEVYDATYLRDRGPKWRRYAAAGIPAYIIVRLKGLDTVVEVWTEPTGRDRSARSSEAVRYSARPANRSRSTATGPNTAGSRWPT